MDLCRAVYRYRLVWLPQYCAIYADDMATRDELLRNKDETLSLSARRYANNNNTSYTEADDDIYDMGVTTPKLKSAESDNDWAGSDSSKWNATANTYGTLKAEKGPFDKTVSSKDTTVKRSFENADTFQRDRISKMIEQEGEEEYRDYDDDYADDEIYVMEEAERNNGTFDENERPYQNPLVKPIIKVGGLEISLSKAKLYGLLDSNGNVALPSDKRDVTKAKNDARKYFKKMSAPREINADEILEKFDEEKPTFKPMRNKEAEAAMRNPRCGYDFVDRLKAKGDFLDRAFGNSSNAKADKKKTDAAEEAYKERIDKLRCPLCKREQSFQQFSTKQRDCNECAVRFAPAKVHSSIDFETRMAEAERKRAEKLKMLDDQVYAPPPAAHRSSPSSTRVAAKAEAKAAAPSGAAAKATRGAKAAESDKKPANPNPNPNPRIADAKPTARGGAKGSNSSKGPPPERADSSSIVRESMLEQGKLLQKLHRGLDDVATSVHPSLELLGQLARLQNQKAAAINETIKEAERKYSTARSAGGSTATRVARESQQELKGGVQRKDKQGTKPQSGGLDGVKVSVAAPREVLRQLAHPRNEKAATVAQTINEARSKASDEDHTTRAAKGKGASLASTTPAVRTRPSKFQYDDDDDEGDDSDRYSEAFSSLLVE